jgi:voltage-gated potassium channel
MESLSETRRQVRIAIIIIAIILPVGVIGFMALEGLDVLNAIWLTVITLATIGYGDIYARTDAGRIFTIVLIIAGLGSFAFAIQASLSLLFSSENSDSRQRRRAYRRVNQLQNHYIISGEGELVDQTVNYLLRREETRRAYQQEIITHRFDLVLDRIFGRHNVRMRPVRKLARRIYLLPFRQRSLLESVVVITQQVDYARHLRRVGLLVVEGDASDDQILRLAGIKRAQALMALSQNDMETLLTVLAAHSRNSNLFITASVLEDEFAPRMLRVGANNIIKPYEVAGQFLNNVTFRPAVNDFFNTILFDHHRAGSQAVQLFLHEDSPWIGKSLRELQLREQFHAGVIGIRREDGRFVYAPEDSYVLAEDEVVIAVTSTPYITKIVQNCRPLSNHRPVSTNWQPLPSKPFQQQSSREYTFAESKAASAELTGHYIICSGGHVAERAIEKLNPERPFVIISNDQHHAESLLRRGFRVIPGNASDEKTLHQAGINRALAIMISIEDKAQSVLTTLTARTLSRRLLITATADSDDMIARLRRAGADRVISPFRIAAQFLLLATTRPVVSDFLQYVLFNYNVGLETTELYMQDDSPWIGKQLGELFLRRIFNAGVIGVRLASGRFIYNPPDAHIVREEEILIVTVPMEYSDQLREAAHGSTRKHPRSIRREDLLKTSIWMS